MPPGEAEQLAAARGAMADSMLPDALPITLPGDGAAYVDTPLTDTEIEKIRNSVNRQAPFGMEDWRDELCEKIGPESTVRPCWRVEGRKRDANKQSVPLFSCNYPLITPSLDVHESVPAEKKEIWR